MDLFGRGVDCDSIRRGRRAPKCFCRSGKQHWDLPALLFSATVVSDVWERRIYAAVVGGMAAESGFRNGGTCDDGEGAMIMRTTELVGRSPHRLES